MGLANYYRKFIKDYSKRAKLMTDLTKKNLQFKWTKEAKATFQEIKAYFLQQPVLAIFNPKLPIILKTDASDFAIRAVLNQVHPGKIRKPVAFYLRKMTPAELNYNIYNKEMLAIVVAIQVWRCYIEAAEHRVVVKIDHKNLTTFTKASILSRRQARWAEVLSLHNLLIEFAKGSKNGRADALSRCKDYMAQPLQPRAMLKETEEGLQYNDIMLV